jgi:hypothetical protein
MEFLSSNFTFNTNHLLRRTSKSAGPVSRKNGSPSPEGSLSHFFAATRDFSYDITVGRFFKELLPAVWNTGRFLGILKKDKQGENA